VEEEEEWRNKGHTSSKAMHMSTRNKQRWVAGRGNELLPIEVEDHTSF
jgi:hypothetical protein